MKEFKVLIEDSVCYVIKDFNNTMTEADAIRIAEAYFAERKPTVYAERLELSSSDCCE